jgi:phosphoglycolate phosphatase
MHCFQAIIFDFDYTLADSSHGVIDCINFALTKMGFPAVSAEAACRTIGLSLTDTFLQLVGEQHTARSDEFVRLFVRRSDEVMADQTVLFAAVPKVIGLLREKDIALGIVSTKFRYRIETILKREKLLDAFEVIIGGRDVPLHKPDPTGLLTAVEKLAGSPSDALYVGDSVVDAETAKRAAIPFVAVLSGVTQRDAFQGYAPRAILESVAELPDLIAC